MEFMCSVALSVNQLEIVVNQINFTTNLISQ